MTLDVSVVLCTHNPRPVYLSRVLGALRTQTLPAERWELLLIDNASRTKLAEEYDLSWHPNGRHIREDELGLTAARLRGIAESNGPVIVFVDDDNVLDHGYLAAADEVPRAKPFLGVWGGHLEGEFEVPVPDWAGPYLPYLAIRGVAEEKWSSSPQVGNIYPVGAGMCCRRRVAEAYSNECRRSIYRKSLDRRGKQLLSGGDIDLLFTAADVGFGVGLFPQLRLTHLIPADRLTLDYMIRMYEGSIFSLTLLDHLRGRSMSTSTTRTGLPQRVLNWVRIRRLPRTEQSFREAALRGVARATETFQDIQAGRTIELKA